MSIRFIDAITKLDNIAVSSHMQQLPYGRGYEFNGASTADKVHVKPVIPSFLAQGALLREFQERAKEENSADLYIGVGGVINLSYIAALKPRAALLLDINPVQRLFWNQILHDVALNPRPSGFIRRCQHTELKMHAALNGQEDRDAGVLKRWQLRRQYKLSTKQGQMFNLTRSLPEWLRVNSVDRQWVSQEPYSVLHDMAQSGKIAALTLDIADNEGVSQLRACLDDLGLSADFFHVSNVLNFMAYNCDWVGRDNDDGDLLSRAIANIRSLGDGDNLKVIGDDGYIDLDDPESLDFKNRKVCCSPGVLGL